MEVDEILLRDIPYSAAELLRRAGAVKGLVVEDPDAAGSLPDPMADPEALMTLTVPRIATPDDARILVEAIYRTREDVPEARTKFENILRDSKETWVGAVLNRTLRESLLKERLIRARSVASDDFVESAKDTGLGLMIDAILGTLGPVGSVLAGMLKRGIDRRATAKAAPWKVSTELLRDRLEPRLSQG
jgi:hypothetical protein